MRLKNSHHVFTTSFGFTVNQTWSVVAIIISLNLLFIAGLCVPSSRLYPFGPLFDQAFTEADDQSTSLNLTSSFVFYGISHNVVFVSKCILHMNAFIVYILSNILDKQQWSYFILYGS